MNSTFVVVLLLLISISSVSAGLYLPGVSPSTFIPGDPVSLQRDERENIVLIFLLQIIVFVVFDFTYMLKFPFDTMEYDYNVLCTVILYIYLLLLLLFLFFSPSKALLTPLIIFSISKTNKCTQVVLKVNKVTSTKTQLPFDYYDMPFCRNKKDHKGTDNLGESISGDTTTASPYQVIGLCSK